MSVKIRLARHGSKKRPFYWLVAANSRSPRDGKYLEKLGTFNPLLADDNPEKLKINGERATHWINSGAIATDKAEKLLGLIGIKVPGSNLDVRVRKSKERKAAEIAAKKAQEELEAKQKAAEEAAKAAQEAADKAAAETVAEAPAAQ